MILRSIARTRCWHVLARIGFVTSTVAAATALQLPVEIEVPGEPFLLSYIVVVVSACLFGRAPGFVAVAETTIASVLYFEPVYSLRLVHPIDLLVIEIYAVGAALSVEAFCRLVDGALVEKSDANSARFNLRETSHRLANDLATVAAILGASRTGSIDIKSLMAELRETAAKLKASEVCCATASANCALSPTRSRSESCTVTPTSATSSSTSTMRNGSVLRLSK